MSTPAKPSERTAFDRTRAENRAHPAQPSPGAMRAANRINGLTGDFMSDENELQAARVIDAETHTRELAEALAGMLETPYQSIAEQTATFSRARAALAAYNATS